MFGFKKKKDKEEELLEEDISNAEFDAIIKFGFRGIPETFETILSMVLPNIEDMDRQQEKERLTFELVKKIRKDPKFILNNFFLSKRVKVDWIKIHVLYPRHTSQKPYKWRVRV